MDESLDERVGGKLVTHHFHLELPPFHHQFVHISDLAGTRTHYPCDFIIYTFFLVVSIGFYGFHKSIAEYVVSASDVSGFLGVQVKDFVGVVESFRDIYLQITNIATGHSDQTVQEHKSGLYGSLRVVGRVLENCDLFKHFLVLVKNHVGLFYHETVASLGAVWPCRLYREVCDQGGHTSPSWILRGVGDLVWRRSKGLWNAGV